MIRDLDHWDRLVVKNPGLNIQRGFCLLDQDADSQGHNSLYIYGNVTCVVYCKASQNYQYQLI